MMNLFVVLAAGLFLLIAAPATQARSAPFPPGQQTLVTDPEKEAVNCVWAAWTPVSACTQTCGVFVGIQKFQRVRAVEPSNGGYNCKGSATKLEPCSFPNTPCPMDCMWGPWKNSSCSEPCGLGTLTQTRTPLVEATEGGKDCQGDTTRSVVCGTANTCAVGARCDNGTDCISTVCDTTALRCIACASDADCDGTCSNGQCVQSGPGAACKTNSGCESEACNTTTKQCLEPVNCKWSTWSAMSDCSSGSCGLLQSRTRSVTTARVGRGTPCEGPSADTIACPGIPNVRFVRITGYKQSNFPNDDVPTVGDSQLALLTVSQLAVYTNDLTKGNIARGKPCESSVTNTTATTCEQAFDGFLDPKAFPFVFMSGNVDNQFLQVDLQSDQLVTKLQVVNRKDSQLQRMIGMIVELVDKDNHLLASYSLWSDSTQHVILTKVTPRPKNVKSVVVSQSNAYLSVAQLAVFARNVNVGSAANGATCQATSSWETNTDCKKAIDGTLKERPYPFHYQSNKNVQQSYLRIILQRSYDTIDRIEFYNRQDCCQDRILGAKISLLDPMGQLVAQYSITNSGPMSIFNVDNSIPFGAMCDGTCSESAACRPSDEDERCLTNAGCKSKRCVNGVCASPDCQWSEWMCTSSSPCKGAQGAQSRTRSRAVVSEATSVGRACVPAEGFEVISCANPGVEGVRYVKISGSGTMTAGLQNLQIAQLAIYDATGTNIAVNKPCMDTGVLAGSKGCAAIVDGKLVNRVASEAYVSANGNPNAFVRIDLQSETAVTKVVFYNVVTNSERAINTKLQLLSQSGEVISEYTVTVDDKIQTFYFSPLPLVNRYVRLTHPNSVLSLSQIVVFANGSNFAVGSHCNQSSIYSTPSFGLPCSNAIDGVLGARLPPNITQSDPKDKFPVMLFDLLENFVINSVTFWNRGDEESMAAPGTFVELLTAQGGVTEQFTVHINSPSSETFTITAASCALSDY